MSYESRRLVHHRVDAAQADVGPDGFIFLLNLQPNEILYDVSAAVTEDPTDGGYLDVWVEYVDLGVVNQATVCRFNDAAEDATQYPDLLTDSGIQFAGRPTKYLALTTSHRVLASFQNAEDSVGRAAIHVVVATPDS